MSIKKAWCVCFITARSSTFINLMLFLSAVTFHTWSNPSFFILESSDDDGPVVMFHVLSLSCLPAFTFPPLQNNPHLIFLCFSFKVLAGMNVHPAEFDGLKQEYNVKGYPTFCYFEWVKSCHLSHFRPALACKAQNIRVGPLQTEVQSRSLKHPQKWWWQTHSLQCWSPRFRSCIYQVKRKKFLTFSGIFLYSLWKSKLAVRGWDCQCCRVQLRVTVRDRLQFLM